ncbi:hypothetical protein RhiTH_011292 [Rhizoctonia solani]
MTVYSVAISPDGSRIAAAGLDNAVYMFNAHNGTPALKPLFAHALWINSVAFSLDGRYLASGGVGDICLWDATSGKLLLGPLRAHGSWVESILFSPNSRHIVSALDNSTIQMWDVGNGTLTPTNLVGRHKDKVNSVAFSPNGERFVLGCGDGKICMWDSKTLSLVFDPFGLHKHTKPITSVTFLPDGRLVASASNDGNICIFDLHGGIVGTPGPSKLDPLTPDLRERHRAIAGGLTIDGDGWARGRNSQLLFWVPTNLLKLFPALENVYTIGPEGILHTDYSQPLLLGEEWHGCYVG